MINFFRKTLSLMNTMEGFIHIIIAAIGFWGVFALMVFDWRVTSGPSMNLLLGLFSLFTGYVLIANKFNFLKKILAFFNALEGVIHLVIAGIGFWGIFAEMIFDWRIWATPVENLFFGIFSLLTGYILGIDHHHGHHHSYSLKSKKEK